MSAGESPFPLHPDVERVLRDVFEAITMLKSGVYHPYGAPADHAGGCSEKEAHDACEEALIDVSSLLRLSSAAGWASLQQRTKS